MNYSQDYKQKNVIVLDAIVVGAGVGGMYMLHRLREQGLKVRVFDDAPGVGGTWYWNRYPGARCDVASTEYSYSFSDEIQQEWTWSEEFAGQPEILRYLNFVADKLNLRSDISFETRVLSAIYSENAKSWTVETSGGDTVVAKYCIMATGNLSSPHFPDIPGLRNFKGEVYHSARWPEGQTQFGGKRVGVIGTGSTGIQLIQTIAPSVGHLTVFQRTPAYAIPAKNQAMTAERVAEVKSTYAEIRKRSFEHYLGMGYMTAQMGLRHLPREERDRHYHEGWKKGAGAFMGCFPELWFNKEENDLAAEFIRQRIRNVVVDKNVAAALTPTDYHVGTKRICLEMGYYDVFNQPNTELVDLRKSPIERITENGVLAGEMEYPLDILIFATGFDAITGALIRIDIRGRGGKSLQEAWKNGPRTYLGLAAPDFPNLFIMNGPTSPSPVSNFFPAIEQNVDWIADCIAFLRESGRQTIEAVDAAQQRWMDHVNEVAGQTLFLTANSWFMGANIPGKARQIMVYLGGFPSYSQRCADVARNGYHGFALDA
ncbi:cyclohexanone monooxygenase [Paraburkholderia sp. BL27I4N3]|uniref:flavin-containing monooxygenase n=1 Tax=Paraburkholderia sp. BL27I4N3 TaxID=1938805 RepID=UPI000E2507EE|nr:NAD(P)/FAD-dependent oxidoreductase [Paraburkholderia sp. BL27I4N3]REE06475.1 cyclohexanone monooxygenase [Paraburkholderia sp. BL27I4N3]